jgi:hypothetical protein
VAETKWESAEVFCENVAKTNADVTKTNAESMAGW